MPNVPIASPLSLSPAGSPGSTVEATAFGGHVLSWRCRGRERLYLSPHASVGAGKAIRGGIPVIFPQFAERGPGPRHGFARTCAWDAVETGPERLLFRFADDETTRASWPHRFVAELSVEPASDRLRTALTIRNRGDEVFEFTAALHTYLRVADVAGTLVHGLEDRPYLDSTRQGLRCEPDDAPVRFEAELDRIYPDVHRPLRLTDGEELLRLEAEGFSDVVVWNPGRELAAGMNDLGADEYHRFVCVEAAAVLVPIRLEPGQAWTGAQILVVEERADA